MRDRRRSFTVVAMCCAAFILFIELLVLARSYATRSPRAIGGTENQLHSNSDHLGAVSSNAFQCSKIGIEILQAGGNAVDAAVAVEFCLGVISLDLTGLGGGGFALVREQDGEYCFVDFRETAPGASTRDMYNSNISASLYGGLASGVPGEARGLACLYEKYGSMPWERLVWPAVEIARNGFIMGYDLDQSIYYTDDPGFLTNDPSWAMDLAPNGTLLHQGQKVVRERYADTLESIAIHGADVFYEGTVAEATVAALRAAGGIMTLEDLRTYNVAIRRTLSIDHHGYKLTSTSAPSGGPVVLNVMQTAGTYEDFGDLALVNISTHRLDEAIRFGYGARTKLADPSFVHNVTWYEMAMIEKRTGLEMRAKISDQHTLPVEAYNPDKIATLENKGTSHLSVADARGMAVSLTSTINDGFGSRVMVPETGVIMNDEMNDFSVPGQSNEYGYAPSAANFIEPGKRPLSSMSPVIVEYVANKTLSFVVGAAGGSRIITAVLQVLWHVLDQGLSLSEALHHPRFHDQLVPNKVRESALTINAY